MREQETDRSHVAETEQREGLERGQRTSVKRNRPPSYNKGYRNEIVKVLLTCGTFSYKSLELYGEKKEMCRRKLKKMEEETFAKIIMGKADISEFDTFVENWKNQGGDQILKEINDELSK